MWYNHKYTTFRRFIVIAGIVAVLGAMTLTDLGSWAAIIAAFFVVLAFGIESVGYLNRRYNLFSVYFEQTPDDKKRSLSLPKSPNPQDVKITLRMKASATIQYINLAFVGTGQIPIIQKLYDHNLAQEHPDFRWIKRDDGSWNGQIIRQPFRTSIQGIYIGMTCLTSGSFRGNLQVVMASEEGTRKTRSLRFYVVKSNND